MDKLMEPSSTLQWVDRALVKPNDYNPNKVSKQNLELLTQSIFTNGMDASDCCKTRLYDY